MSGTPSDRKYSKTHEWFLASGDVVTIGITQHAADALTDITFVDLPGIGDSVAAGQPFGEIESVKATSDLVSSIDGEVIELNQDLADHPEWVNSDPFGKGWMIKVRAASLAGLEPLLDAAAYAKLLAEN